MALPAGLKISDAIQFVPTAFDILIGYNQKIAGIVTRTDTANNDIDVYLFPPFGNPTYRRNVKFSTDVTNGDPYFIMPVAGDDLPSEEPLP